MHTMSLCGESLKSSQLKAQLFDLDDEWLRVLGKVLLTESNWSSGSTVECNYIVTTYLPTSSLELLSTNDSKKFQNFDRKFQVRFSSCLVQVEATAFNVFYSSNAQNSNSNHCFLIEIFLETCDHKLLSGWNSSAEENVSEPTFTSRNNWERNLLWSEWKKNLSPLQNFAKNVD